MKIQDIHIADRDLWAQYIQAFADGQYDQAAAILANAQIVNKSMTKDVMNEAADELAALEDYYYAGVEQPLAQHLAAFNQMVADLANKQAYTAATVYAKGNFVTYNNAVYVYINNTAASGHVPTDTTYWLYLGLRGDDGRDGISLKMRYAWSSATQYAANDAVVYKGVMYFAKTANMANAPDEYPSIWGVLFDLVQARIFAQEDEPIRAYDGLIWFDMEGGN